MNSRDSSKLNHSNKPNKISKKPSTNCQKKKPVFASSDDFQVNYGSISNKNIASSDSIHSKLSSLLVQNNNIIAYDYIKHQLYKIYAQLNQNINENKSSHEIALLLNKFFVLNNIFLDYEILNRKNIHNENTNFIETTNIINYPQFPSIDSIINIDNKSIQNHTQNHVQLNNHNHNHNYNHTKKSNSLKKCSKQHRKLKYKRSYIYNKPSIHPKITGYDSTYNYNNLLMSTPRSFYEENRNKI
ncbi:uncharacterized protein ASCRUDRAFT_9385 [Ascoidea rubescens DSM 1968]|uniref:Uncharacterized protein n=1 Tax=Ascoidea rubescens DSM 1968 TaxID=1344418 RepID=A0A1D2VE00_9ASCO|nr:hypothetical protein ASCRUDRAFT_9385 [Ascoidea rubescens DSM 1968]ODV59740.1 hypothetical protein ASCRUDRAFT_9385 [Ascoidea rubescens DSM 1968]